MFPIITDGVGVYIYKELDDRFHFLQLRRRDDDDTYGQSWHPVYGGVEGEETAMQTARREMMEETGLKSEQMILIEYLETFYFRPRNAIQMLPVFAARVDTAAEVVLNEEHSDFRWIDEDEIADKFVWRSQRQALVVIIETLRQFPDRLQLLRV